MKLLSTIIRKAGSLLWRIARIIDSSIFENTKPITPHQQQFINWGKQKGDLTLRLAYPLTSESVVFDLGGYVGGWASDIYAMYQAKVYVFEPHPDFFHFISDRFRQNKDILVFPFGLGGKDEEIRLSSDEFSSSAYSQQKPTEVVAQLVEANKFLKEKEIASIDLIKINIEGGEYDLLDHLLETSWITKIRHLQIQFHIFVPDAERRRERIRQQLSATHTCTYNFEFVWENWTLK